MKIPLAQKELILTPAANDIAARAEVSDTFMAIASSLEFGRSLVIFGDSELFETDGPTGTAEMPIAPGADWRACTIAIRMLNQKDVPTLSQWGHLSVAIFALFAGIWFLRRKAKS